MELPVIDMSPLFEPRDCAANRQVAGQIRDACRTFGFFYVVGHGMDPLLPSDLETASRRFFALPESEKMKLAMRYGGRAWRGYFPFGDELTSGIADQKEGLYFGSELPRDHPRVASGMPLHGPNLWPAAVPELRGLVLEYIDTMATIAQTLLTGIAMSLDLPRDYFRSTYTSNPTLLFRIFHYPPTTKGGWGVGEHTDYGLLTLLAQDRHGGLQVKTGETWIDAPPLDGALVCNLGDMLDRLTGGWFRSTLHRVRNASGHARLSFPFFFDPDFEAVLEPLPSIANRDPGRPDRPRWDDSDLLAFKGTYGDYLIGKVSRVFPQLSDHLDGS